MSVKAVSSEYFDFRYPPIIVGVRPAHEIFGQHGFPREFVLRSRKTGECRTFKVIDKTDPKFDEDHWDGEMQYYKPKKPIKGIDYVVVRAG
jgi:hypothetical protein